MYRGKITNTPAENSVQSHFFMLTIIIIMDQHFEDITEYVQVEIIDRTVYD
jgi:hypothetical protein